MEKEQFLLILDRYLKGDATVAEQDFLFAYYNLFQADADVMQMLDVDEQLRLKLLIREGIDRQIDHTNLQEEQVIKQIKLWPRILVVAAAVAAIVFGIWFFNTSSHVGEGKDLLTYTNDVAPGKNGATITLANGEVIRLSDTKPGVVVGDVLKYSDGSDVAELQGVNVRVQNLVAGTARGQTYQFTLPDGTNVWLNADSKISFPSQFNEKERKVLLTGEAYFAVKHDARQPFKVESKGQIVEDMGTEFNINAYEDELVVRTTLVEGSASVNKTLLVPNQQASLKDGQIRIRQVDPEEAISWKSGLFLFADEPLESIMRKVERWYDVEVIYTNESLRTETFKGSVSRYDKVSRILKTLEFTGVVKFKIEGNRITVMK